MKRKSLIISCIAGLAMTLLSGCSLYQGNLKYAPWDLATSTPVADPEITDVSTPIIGRGSYWSFLYLFGVYEVDNKYAGFDILYFIDFTKIYRSGKMVYENADPDDYFLWSRSKRLKKMVLNKMCLKTNQDVVLSPMYKLDNNDFPILWQESAVKARAYSGKVIGFKVRGRMVNDAYFPDDKNGPKTPFITKPSR